MKGLRKIIYPFAPDQSGAAAVFYELGGMIIICDAGGCAGNICGFDEPRWFQKKSAIFSAGLRDMDAILGRDDLMIDKIAKASKKLEASFVAIIGTPVPATIATDYHAVKRMGEKRIGLPVVTVDTNGALLYDSGAEKAYLALFERFAEEGDVIPGTAGVLGVTPLDTDRLDAPELICAYYKAQGIRAFCYGTDDGLDAVRYAGRMEKNIVAAPSGLKAAKYLKNRFGTPYVFEDPLIRPVWDGVTSQLSGSDPAAWFAGKKVLIIHQQVRANALREKIRQTVSESDPGNSPEITVASWFRMAKQCRMDQDVRIREEEQFMELVKAPYDVIIADASFRKAARGFDGIWIDLPHFAVSGEMGQENIVSPRFYSADTD